MLQSMISTDMSEEPGGFFPDTHSRVYGGDAEACYTVPRAGLPN